MSKEEIWHFIDWIRSKRAIELSHDNGYDRAYNLWDKEIEILIDDYIFLREEE